MGEDQPRYNSRNNSNIFLLPRGLMNCSRRQGTTFLMAAIVAATVALMLTAATIPAQAQTYKVLYNFGTNANDPLQPNGIDAIAQGRDGNLYTTSNSGGTGNVGTMFKVTPSGTLSVVYNFAYSPGNDPMSGVTLGTDGNFYGTTKLNGEGPGTAYKITPAG